MLPLRNSSAWAGPTPRVSVRVWGCVCIKLMTIKYTNTITNVDTHAHSHARQVIQISKANSEPGREPDPKPETRPSPSARQQDCANILPATETKTYYYRMLPMCGWVCVCVCVCAQIEFDLLKFDIFRDTSTANQANTSQEQRQDESDRHRNNQHGPRREREGGVAKETIDEVLAATKHLPHI